MTQDSTAVISKASEIINRFGGIRPMSTKTGIPVTTIQGWKQRDAIPANRRYELVDAANKNGINLSDLLMEIAGDKPNADDTGNQEIFIAGGEIPKRHYDDSHSDLKPASNQAMFIGAGALILAAAILGMIIAIAPDVKQATGQAERIAQLEQQIENMKSAQNSSSSSSFLPDGLGDKLSSLEGQVGALSEQAKSYSAVIDDLQTGTMSERLTKLESHMGGLLEKANAFGLQEVVQKIQAMQSTTAGLGQVDGLIAAFLGTAQTATPDQLSQSFTQLRETNPDVAETFKNVAPEDMQAAVMLMGMAQLRESLARDNDSFEQDLGLLKVTLAQDNPELVAAIDRLAPQAKSGVLTPTGLSQELRGLTGEIVAAELSGKDVSIQDKLTARLGQMVQVEKDGQRISGTQTQITIAEAQKKLDTGDVAGAVALLQSIQGPAAEKVQPIISQSNATLLAGQVQQLLGQNLLLKLKGLGNHSVPYMANSGGLKGLVSEINNATAGLRP